MENTSKCNNTVHLSKKKTSLLEKKANDRGHSFVPICLVSFARRIYIIKYYCMCVRKNLRGYQGPFPSSERERRVFHVFKSSPEHGIRKLYVVVAQ